MYLHTRLEGDTSNVTPETTFSCVLTDIDTLVNQDDHATTIRSPVRGPMGFSKSRGLRASVPFFPLAHPLPSTLSLSPHFSQSPNAKKSFAWPEFRSLRMGTLATQASLANVCESSLLLSTLTTRRWAFMTEWASVSPCVFHSRAAMDAGVGVSPERLSGDVLSSSRNHYLIMPLA